MWKEASIQTSRENIYTLLEANCKTLLPILHMENLRFIPFRPQDTEGRMHCGSLGSWQPSIFNLELIFQMSPYQLLLNSSLKRYTGLTLSNPAIRVLRCLKHSEWAEKIPHVQNHTRQMTIASTDPMQYADLIIYPDLNKLTILKNRHN